MLAPLVPLPIAKNRATGMETPDCRNYCHCSPPPAAVAWRFYRCPLCKNALETMALDTSQQERLATMMWQNLFLHAGGGEG